ncbi:copper chaperone CopZ [Alkalihalobacillus oceani]|uniref:Copper chaperone CopZ n=1 Tax=Halalkalibacter oceani TaxID=1653776 RepID=A0A9X2IPN9_9BACI|nr:copper chaperone CopZ [Halalkalibacter oceani]MCM3763036.1 copper chaperone CopZ [Halalkalibacter oceani]
MEEKTLIVKGMSCGHCVNSIEGNVGQLGGVKSVKVLLDKGKVLVEYDSKQVSLNEIKHVIEEQGYDIEE